MSEMVERVAKAITKNIPGVFSDYHAEDLARAAIAAMREPTARMVTAGDGRDKYPIYAIWTAMIGEALK